MPWKKIERERHNRDRTAAESDKQIRQAVERDERRQRRIAQVGGLQGERVGSLCSASAQQPLLSPCSAHPLLPCSRQAGIDYAYEPLGSALPAKSKKTRFD